MSSVYSKHEEVYPNVNIAQSIVHFFVRRVTSGKLKINPLESLDVEHMLRLYSPIHQTSLLDFLIEKKSVFR